MAQIGVDGDAIVVGLTPLERLAALHGDVRVPRASVAAVAPEDEPYKQLRGIRAPGTSWPNAIAYGVRRFTGGRPDFAALRGRGPAIRIELDPPARFARLLVSVDDPAATVARIRA
jgi:hypothetical protein